MSHGARVIRTGVSSAGPASTSPPAASSSASASSDGELVDGAYFRSCAGMLKVAQMVRRQGRGGGVVVPRLVARFCGEGAGRGAGLEGVGTAAGTDSNLGEVWLESRN